MQSFGNCSPGNFDLNQKKATKRSLKNAGRAAEQSSEEGQSVAVMAFLLNNPH